MASCDNVTGSGCQKARETQLRPALAQYAAQPLGRDNGRQAALAVAGQIDAGHITAEMGLVFQEPMHAAVKIGHGVHEIGFQGFDGQQWHQADQGTNFQRKVVAIGQMQMVVVKAILFVPQADAMLGNGRGNGQEMLKKLGGQILVNAVFFRQFQGNFHHFQAEKAHPGRTVRLIQVPASGQAVAAVENADIVQSQKAALKNIVAVIIFAIYPPGKIEQQLVEDRFQKRPVWLAGLRGVDLVDAPGSPGMNRRIDIAKGPFVGRELAVGVHVPFAGHENELPFGKVRVNQGQGQAVEGQVPGRIPGIFPLVGHGDDVEVVEVMPVVVTAVSPGCWRGWGGGIAVQPLVHVEVVKLLGPQHAGKCLPLHVVRIFCSGLVAEWQRKRHRLPPAALPGSRQTGERGLGFLRRSSAGG